jgi:branched-chain amino acid transport system permease protein
VVIVVLQNELAGRVGSWVTVIMGVIFVTCVLAFRRGIVGEIAARLPAARAKRDRDVPAARPS